jgi:glycosyltransferase involved in cell wall biosynthesis
MVEHDRVIAGSSPGIGQPTEREAPVSARSEGTERLAELERLLAAGLAENRVQAQRIADLQIEAERERQRGKIAYARQARLRDRLGAAMLDLSSIQGRLAAIEASTSWRVTAPLRRLGDAMPPLLVRHARRAARLLWWTVTLQLPNRWRQWRIARERPPVEPASPMTVVDTALPAAAAVDPDGAPIALIIDYRWPQPDRDSGSIDTMNLVAALFDLGFRVVYSANCDYAEAEADQRVLTRHGVRCIPSGAPIQTFIEHEARGIELCVLTRVFGGGQHLEEVQKHCPAARLVFNPVDLHFIRIAREARLKGDAEALDFAGRLRLREEFIASEVDATIVVSSHEEAVLTASVPDAYVVQLPLARQMHAPQTGFEIRHGIGFIAGFAHAPNVDALRFFLAEIWPLVLRQLPDCEFSIVGADLPPEIVQGVPGRVRYLGHLPDVEPWFESLRLTIAPLRFGAGAKGKIASSLAAGVPCVATALGIEGMGLRDRVNVLLADDPDKFSAGILEAYTDPKLWERLSTGAQAYAREELALAGWNRRLRDMLWTIGVLAD